MRNELKKLGKAEESHSESSASVDLDTIILAGLERGLTMQDIRRMQLGQVVDFCIAFNERHKQDEIEEKPGKKRPRKSRRKGTQADINAFFG